MRNKWNSLWEPFICRVHETIRVICTTALMRSHRQTATVHINHASCKCVSYVQVWTKRQRGGGGGGQKSAKSALFKRKWKCTVKLIWHLLHLLLPPPPPPPTPHPLSFNALYHVFDAFQCFIFSLFYFFHCVHAIDRRSVQGISTAQMVWWMNKLFKLKRSHRLVRLKEHLRDVKEKVSRKSND